MFGPNEAKETGGGRRVQKEDLNNQYSFYLSNGSGLRFRRFEAICLNLWIQCVGTKYTVIKTAEGDEEWQKLISFCLRSDNHGKYSTFHSRQGF